MRYLTIVGLLLGQRRRQWTNNNPTLDQCIVLADKKMGTIPADKNMGTVTADKKMGTITADENMGTVTADKTWLR